MCGVDVTIFNINLVPVEIRNLSIHLHEYNTLVPYTLLDMKRCGDVMLALEAVNHTWFNA